MQPSDLVAKPNICLANVRPRYVSLKAYQMLPTLYVFYFVRSYDQHVTAFYIIISMGRRGSVSIVVFLLAPSKLPSSRHGLH